MRRALASAALALVVLDVTAVGVLLPTLRTDLGSSPSGGQWIMNAHLLALAVVLPLALRARVDRRLAVGAGAAALAAGAIVCATADSTSTLVIGRALEGAGTGALIVPVTGLGAAVLPLAALAFGPLVGGELAQHNWWHLWFWAALPAAAVLAGIALLERDRQPAERRGPTGRELALGAALVAGTIVLVQSEPWGLESSAVVTALAVVAALALGNLDADRAAWAAAGGALAALCFLLPQYFELAHLIHPLRSGVRLSVLTVAAVGGGVAGWWLRSRAPREVPALAGALVAAAGLVALGTLGAHSGSAAMGAGLLLTGAGFGIATGAAGSERAGELLVAAGGGAALTLAFAGALFQQVQASERAGGSSFEQALSSGVDRGVLILLVLAAAAAWPVWRARPARSAAPRAAES